MVSADSGLLLRTGTRIQALVGAMVGRPWFWMVAVAIPFSWPIYLALTTGVPAPIPVLGQLPDVSVKAQNGRSLDRGDLAQRAWVMNFATLNEPATDGSVKALEKVQYRARNLGQTFGLITWVLDGNGAVERVADYVSKRPISPRMWWFIPTTPPEVLAAMREAVAHSVGGPLSVNDEKRFGSGNTLFLIDPRGRLRGIYDASDQDSLDKLLHDAGLIINRGY